MTTMRRLLFPAARALFMLAMLFGTALIALGSVEYFSGDLLHPFILEKLPLPLPFEALWLAALKVHVACALVALPGCVVLLSKKLVGRWPRLHRVAGRVIGAVILLGLVPSGAVLAFSAKGGTAGTLGFLLSGAIVAVAMTKAIAAARARRIAAHRRLIGHVVAQLSVAVTSRVLLVALDAGGMDATVAYLVALWLPVITSAACVELLHHRPSTLPTLPLSPTNEATPEGRSRHESDRPLALVFHSVR